MKRKRPCTALLILNSVWVKQLAELIIMTTSDSELSVNTHSNFISGLNVKYEILYKRYFIQGENDA